MTLCGRGYLCYCHGLADKLAQAEIQGKEDWKTQAIIIHDIGVRNHTHLTSSSPFLYERPNLGVLRLSTFSVSKA